MFLATTLHLLAAIVWVGGMFFAHLALRPAANLLLEPPQRLPLMLKVFDGFFPWVWLAVVLLLGTGYWMFLGVMQGKAPLYIHIMAGFGTLMAAIFAFIYAKPYRRMARSLAEGKLEAAAAHLTLIRHLITANLVLGLVISALAVGGRYF